MMRLIKLAIISFIVFFLLITAISLFIPAHVRISKATDINAAKDSVMQQISNAANWKNWYPGADTLQVLQIDGVAKGILTKGQQGIIITGSDDSTVTAGNAGTAPGKGEMGWNILQSRGKGPVTVQWYMDFRFSWYPWEKFSSLLLEKRYGLLMEQGLDKLKKFLEK
jgi:hypothetical protein